jgi:hypothetical protein
MDVPFQASRSTRGLYKKVVRGMPRNHAATIGENAIDGWGEFIQGGEEGGAPWDETVKCSAYFIFFYYY